MPNNDERTATTHAEGFQRHEQRPDNWEQAEAVTGRPNDIPIDDPEPAPLGGNSTLAQRAKANAKADAKQVDPDATEDKAVTSAATKTKRTRKS